MPTWTCGPYRFEIGSRPLVMGIVNVTPDSFSDGGRFASTAAAIEHGRKLLAEGADILDIGGESTRPGSEPVSEQEELRRVLPVVVALAANRDARLSVDTTKAAVARRCLDAGACIVNDVTGLRGDSEMPQVLAETGAGAIVMHMQGTPGTMQANPTYGDVVREVGEFFEERLRTLTEFGVAAETLCLDPGIGFGKTIDHNLDLLANLGAFAHLHRPIALGVSRKRFIGTICERDVADRMPGSLAAACLAAASGAVHLLRVHDVGPTRDAVRLIEAFARHRH